MFDLWEVKLDIINCSNIPVQENEVVHEIWENIIEEGKVKDVARGSLAVFETVGVYFFYFFVCRNTQMRIEQSER